jgi:hypothetical protein
MTPVPCTCSLSKTFEFWDSKGILTALRMPPYRMRYNETPKAVEQYGVGAVRKSNRGVRLTKIQLKYHGKPL